MLDVLPVKQETTKQLYYALYIYDNEITAAGPFDTKREAKAYTRGLIDANNDYSGICIVENKSNLDKDVSFVEVII